MYVRVHRGRPLSCHDRRMSDDLTLFAAAGSAKVPLPVREPLPVRQPVGGFAGEWHESVMAEVAALWWEGCGVRRQTLLCVAAWHAAHLSTAGSHRQSRRRCSDICASSRSSVARADELLAEAEIIEIEKVSAVARLVRFGPLWPLRKRRKPVDNYPGRRSGGAPGGPLEGSGGAPGGPLEGSGGAPGGPHIDIDEIRDRDAAPTVSVGRAASCPRCGEACADSELLAWAVCGACSLLPSPL